jgi:hypothetical protein
MIGENDMKKNTILMTKIFMLVVFLIVVVYDIVMATNKIQGDTISEITLFYSFRIAFIPYALGFLCGHLFWPMDKKRSIHAIVSILIGIITGIILTMIVKKIGVQVTPIIFLILGIPCGHLLWPQQKKAKEF